MLSLDVHAELLDFLLQNFLLIHQHKGAFQQAFKPHLMEHTPSQLRQCSFLQKQGRGNSLPIQQRVTSYFFFFKNRPGTKQRSNTKLSNAFATGTPKFLMAPGNASQMATTLQTPVLPNQLPAAFLPDQLSAPLLPNQLPVPFLPNQLLAVTHSIKVFEVEAILLAFQLFTPQ